MGRRDRHEIALDILRAAKHPIRKTHFMYKARLSYSQLHRYLDSMIDSGLIENCKLEEKRHDGVFYKTTEKGLDFMRNLELAESLWNNNDHLTKS